MTNSITILERKSEAAERQEHGTRPVEERAKRAAVRACGADPRRASVYTWRQDCYQLGSTTWEATVVGPCPGPHRRLRPGSHKRSGCNCSYPVLGRVWTTIEWHL